MKPSRQLWTAVADCVFSLVLLVVAHFWPDQADFIKAVVLCIQPLAVAIIAQYTSQDIAAAVKSLK